MGDKDDVFERYAKENPAVVGRMEEILGRYYNEERVVKTAVASRTMIPRLDLALYGGIPAGVTEIFGPESSGKTALLGAILASAQQQGKATALIATEDLDVGYWHSLGVDLENLLLIEIEDIRDAPELVAECVHEPEYVLGIDSITALRGVYGAVEDFLKWRDTILELLRGVNERISERSALVVTSQVRARKSADPVKTFAGGTESASRGVLGEFMTRLELSRREVQDERYTLLVNVVANVFGPPARFIELPAVKGSGIDSDLDLIRVADELGLISRKGTWYSLGGKLYHGAHAAARALEDRPVLRKLLLHDEKGVYSYL